MKSHRAFWLLMAKGLPMVMACCFFTATVNMQGPTTTRYVYDVNGRLTAVVTPEGVAVYQYDEAGNFTAIRRVTTRPTILEFFQHEGLAGDRVSFVGVGFGARVEDNQVSFSNGAAARIVSASTAEIVAEVPPAAVTGPVTIITPEGTATTSEPFVIVPPLSVVPPTAVVRFGEAVPFTARVRLSGDRTVVWSVNGVSGGNSALGIVTPSGLYIAPLTMPPAPVVLRVTSSARPELFSEAAVTVGRVDVTPPELIVQPGEHGDFSAAVSVVPGTPAVTWSVNGVPG